ncbi:MAG: CAP domain-containing protein, partial [Actinomycetota bacterium]
MLRRLAFIAVALLAFFGGPLGMGRAQAGYSSDLTAMTNADRAAARLRALSTAGDLQSLAQRRSDEMARAGRIYHTSNLGSKVSGWKRLGENVGRGPALRDIETAFMNSPSHRENILDRGFTQLGVGVTFDGKEFLYVAVIFREPSGAATASAPPPPPPTTTPTSRAAQAPKPRPKPTTTTQAPTT